MSIGFQDSVFGVLVFRIHVFGFWSLEGEPYLRMCRGILHGVHDGTCKDNRLCSAASSH